MEARPPTDNWIDALGSEKLYTSGTDHLKNKINFLYKTWEIFLTTWRISHLTCLSDCQQGLSNSTTLRL